jgi:hypothetical protein
MILYASFGVKRKTTPSSNNPNGVASLAQGKADKNPPGFIADATLGYRPMISRTLKGFDKPTAINYGTPSGFRVFHFATQGGVRLTPERRKSVLPWAIDGTPLGFSRDADPHQNGVTVCSPNRGKDS